MAQVDRSEEKDWANEGDPTGITLAPGTTVVRIVRNNRGRAMTHWGNDYQGGRHKAVCSGKFKRRGFNIDACPICAAIEKGGAGPIEKGGCGWEINRRYYFAAVRVTMIEKEKTIKKGPRKGEKVTVIVPRFSKMVELLGGRDGIGPRLYNQIVKFLKHPQYGNPLNYNFEIERVGTGFDTEYTVTPQLPDKSGKIPEDLEDPEDLLGAGMAALEAATPVEMMEEWLGMGAGADVITDDMFGADDEEEEDGDDAKFDDSGSTDADEEEEEEEETEGETEGEDGDDEEDGKGAESAKPAADEDEEGDEF